MDYVDCDVVWYCVWCVEVWMDVGVWFCVDWGEVWCGWVFVCCGDLLWNDDGLVEWFWCDCRSVLCVWCEDVCGWC